MREHGGFEIVAVADPIEARREEAVTLTGCLAFPSLEELLLGSDAELIVVATPSRDHFSDILQVLRAGRHCLAEKPLALASEEAELLVRTAREAGLRLFVHHGHLHRDEFHHLRGVIARGCLGPIFHLRTMWSGYSRRWDWQSLKKNGGGQLNNTCPHTLSIVLPLLGSPVTEVYADLRNIKDAGDAEDHVHLALRTAGGATADVVVSSAIALGGPKWVLCGKYGTLISDGQKSTLKYYAPAEVLALEVADGAAPNRQYLRESLPWQTEEIAVEPAEVPSFHANVHDVLLGRAEPLVTPESAADVVRVTALCHAAARPAAEAEILTSCA
ncbi:MAG TPA: Gfo/Idh/MocA family oxidoreductase [Terrimicrobiaceae bacterium]|nr:Gfo/Idh/MocA family oxidoreductase [Terrimicrobiaceae bacterium]